MELHSLDGEFLMSQPHDDARPVFIGCPGAYFQVARQILLRDDKRVIARGSHGRREPSKDGPAIVLDLAGFAMHQIPSPNHFASKGRADRLVPEANAQQWRLARKVADQLDADAGILRCTRSRRDYDALGMHCLNFFDGHFVIAANFNLRAQFTQVLDEVVSERIVVIEDEDHSSIVAVRSGFQGVQGSEFQGFDDNSESAASEQETRLLNLETLGP